MEVVEIGVSELEQFVAVRNAVWPNDPDSVEGLRDGRRQADDMVWLLARRDGEVLGAGLGVVGWHSPPAVGRANVVVLPAARGAGVGAAVLTRLDAWLTERGCTEATGTVGDSDEASLAWASRRGFVEVGRDSILALSLAELASPAVDPPSGVEIVTFAERPELARAMYEVCREATPDIPGQGDEEIWPFQDWLANDMQGASDRPEATFVALLAGEVVGWAKLSIQPGARDVAWHDLTAVLRAARGRGVAGCLQTRRDRLGEGQRLRVPEDVQRGAKRADPPAQRAARLPDRARVHQGPRAARGLTRSARGLSGGGSSARGRSAVSRRAWRCRVACRCAPCRELQPARP